MNKEELMAAMSAMSVEERKALLKEMGDTTTESVLAEARKAVEAQREEMTELQARLKELTEAAEKQPNEQRATLKTLESQMDRKIVDVAELIRKEYADQINGLKNELTKERVLHDYTDLPADYKARIQGASEEEIRQAAEEAKAQYKANEEAIRLRVMQELGIDPDAPKEDDKPAPTEENKEPSIDEVLEQVKGTPAEQYLKQIKARQNSGKDGNNNEGASISTEQVNETEVGASSAADRLFSFGF